MTIMKHTIYLIPGLGADDRLFAKLHIYNARSVHVKWEMPEMNETLESFAKKLSKQIDVTRPFSLIGVSFGGMLAIEIAKLHEPEKIVIISSAKNKYELPWYFRMYSGFPIYKALPIGIGVKGFVFGKHLLGKMKSDDMALFAEMAADIDPKFIRRAIHCIVNWKSDTINPNIIHLHGNRDRLLPLKLVKGAQVIDGGTHFMVVNKAIEINKILNKVFC